jgi:Polyketide cyclase / dehydrase and lipid transport
MRWRSFKTIPIVLGLALGAGSASAEVADSAPAGFTLRQSADVSLPPPAVWAALADIGKWWNPEHSWSGDARNMTLDPVVRGCFCEKLGMYGGVEHMTVIFAQPPKVLRLSGALGPLQDFALTGTMTWRIEVAGGGSKIGLTYAVSGYADKPLSEWAPLVDEVLADQLRRLARYVNTGSPLEAKAEGKK